MSLKILEKEIELAEKHLRQNEENLRVFPDNQIMLANTVSLNRDLNIMCHLRTLYQEIELAARSRSQTR